MRNQFFKILKYEYLGTIRNKVYMVITILVVLLLAVLLSLPNIIDLFSSGHQEQKPDPVKTEQIAVLDQTGKFKSLDFLKQAMPAYTFVAYEGTADALQNDLGEGKYKAGLLFKTLLDCDYMVKNLSLYDTMLQTLPQVMKEQFIADALENQGMSVSETETLLGAEAKVGLVETGKSTMSTYFYTYILIFMLYMAILLYGQLIATSVATEKSSRAMELLVTSANPTSLLFGKVLGSGLAGLTQLALLLGTAFGFYNLNANAWRNHPIVKSIFDMPFNILLYTVLFFILGFFIYAFIFGALGSFASRVEDINTSTMPVIFLFVAALFIAITGMNADVNSGLMVVTSFIPVFSPIIMFVRICMSVVPAWQIIVSVLILIVSTLLVGVGAAKLYRIGVLMYGKPPKLKDLVQVLRNAK